jgi:hypothetical protein
LAITTDNASNNSTFVDSLTTTFASESIDFNPKDQWVRCLAHIINLSVQSALASLTAIAVSSEDEVLEDNDETVTANVTSKVRGS